MLLYFAFQKYKVQSMKSTVQKLIQAKVATGNVEMLESTTRLIMDDESAHKPDEVRSLSARSHREHLNDSEDEIVTK